MSSPNVLAIAAAVAIAASSLAVFSSTSTTATPVTVINGARVTNLAPIVVHAPADVTVASL